MDLSNDDFVIKKVKAGANVQQVLGYVITIFCGMLAFVGIVGSGFKEPIDAVLVTMFIALATFGVVLVFKGRKKKKLVKLFYEYSSLLSKDSQKSLDLLSSLTGLTVSTTTKNVADMIDLELFPNAYIDNNQNRLIFMGYTDIASSSENNKLNDVHELRSVAVKCKSCGATNKVSEGVVSECEFCGSQISC